MPSNYPPGSNTPDAPWNQGDVDPIRCAYCDREETEDKPFEDDKYCSVECAVGGYISHHPEQCEPLTRLYNKISDALKALDDDEEIDTAIKGLGIAIPYQTKERLVELLNDLGAKEDVQPVWMLQ